MGTAVALKGLRVYLVTVDPLRSSRAGRRGRSSFDCLCCCLVLISHRPWFRLFSPVLTRNTHPSIPACPGKYLDRVRLELELTQRGVRVMGDRLAPTRPCALAPSLCSRVIKSVSTPPLILLFFGSGNTQRRGDAHGQKMMRMIEMKTSSSEQIQGAFLMLGHRR
jgi:hypothetical protein